MIILGGGSESENTWLDSSGLVRTDYSDGRGGSLGYITDGNMRNGNFVERILNDMVIKYTPENVEDRTYKRITHADGHTSYYPQYIDFILEGKSPNLKRSADMIHDAILVPSAYNIPLLKTLIEEMTEKALKDLPIEVFEKMNEDEVSRYSTQVVESKMRQLDLATDGYKALFEKIMNRIHADARFENVIKTKEDFDSLPDDDELRVLLEKLALKKNYKIANMDSKLAKINTVSGLKEIKNAQVQSGKDSISYVFNKNMNFMLYLASAYNDDVDNKLIELAAKYGISESDLAGLDRTFDLSKDEYTGSLKQGISVIMKVISENVDKTVKDKEANAAIKKFFRDFINETLYFQESDIDNPEFKNLVSLIDRLYAPDDNKELIRYFRQIQDMTYDEYKENVYQKLIPEDLGIKNYTGYDILCQLNRYEEDAEYNLLNIIYYENFVKNGLPDASSSYRYKRFKRYTDNFVKMDFGETYRRMKYDLILLRYDKLFNKYKDQNIKKYGAYPAYPKVEYANEEFYKKKFDIVIDAMKESLNYIKNIRNQVESYDIHYTIMGLISDMPDDTIIEGNIYNLIQENINRFTEINQNDKAISEAVNAMIQASDIPVGATLSEYQKYFNVFDRIISRYENESESSKLLDLESNHKAMLNDYVSKFVRTSIQPRYQNKMSAYFGDYIDAIVRGKDEETIDIMQENLYEEYKKYNIMHDPDALLREYIKSCAANSKNEDVSTMLESLLARALQYAKLADVQNVLMELMSEGNEMAAKEVFNQVGISKCLSLALGEDMDSEKVLGYMTNSLVREDDTETAEMFLDKLGLKERYVEFMAKDIDVDQIKESIINENEAPLRFEKFKKALETELNTAVEAYKLHGNLNKTVSEFKTVIPKLISDYNLPMLLSGKWSEAADKILDICNKDPNIDKLKQLEVTIYSFITAAEGLFGRKMQEEGEFLSDTGYIYNFVLNLDIPKESPVYEMRNALEAKIAELNALMDQYENNLQEKQNSDKI